MDERPPADEESGGGADVAADEQTAARSGEGTDGSPAPTAADDAAAVDAAAAALASSTASDGDEPGQPDQLSPSSTGSGKRFSAPEPPKWRFVDQAKKSLGYSSYSAGTVVKGLSAEELVGKYEPKWKPSESKTVEHVKEQVAEIDHDVEEAVEKDGGDVGRLMVQEGGDTVEETFEGTFAGFRKKGDQETSADDAQKSAPLANDEIKRVVKEAVKEAMSELVVKAEEGVTEAPDPAEPAIALGIATPAVGDKEGRKIEEPQASNGNDQPSELEKTVEEDNQKKKKRRCLLLLLLLLIVAIMAIALGVTLGGDEKEENSNRAIDGGSLVSEDDNATITPTTTPSMSKSPSALPTPALPTPLGACPSNMKSFTVKNEGVQQQGQPQNSEKTWMVKDACSGEVVLRCPPCSDDDNARRSLTPRQAAKMKRQICIGSTDRPRPVRDGERFRFQLYVNSYGSGACIDGNGRKYQFGLFNAAADFGECADKCVKYVPVDLAMSDSFQGYEFDCTTKECMCLYDAGTLNETHIESFDRVRNEEDYGGGTGSIGGVISLDDRYCGKLVQGRDGGIDYPTYAPKSDIPNPTNAPKDDTKEVENDITGYDGFNSCLPGDKEYIFEVEPVGTDDGGSCCGFAPEAFVAAYDDVVVMRGDWPEGKVEEIDGSSGTSNNLFEGPSLDVWTTKFGTSSEPCPIAGPPPVPSNPPSQPINTPSASAPLPPFQDIVLPVDGGIYPCREVIEAEMAGRINNLTCTFCGHCQWKFSSFNCYQRVTFLVTRYGLGQLEARQNLCAQGRCLVPADGVGPGIQAAIERASYCGEPPVEKEVATGTPTQPPTANPSSAEPTESPTLKPTSWITARPIRSPTLQPTLVEELATGTPTQPPTANPSSAEPTTSPTLKLTSSPTTARPTRSPTLQPTCDTSYEDFNLCFAIDMSGSVCNQGTGFECEGCLPNLICNEGGFDNSTCCANFFSVASFAKSLVDSLEPLPVEKGYSIVGFASGATVALSLGLSEDTVTALDDLVYTGGRTNHADAINACASSLRSSGGDGRNLILLITDGDPSEPQGSPLEDAELAADRAKSEGAFIIPLVVTQESSSLAANQEYLQGISSDGSVFKVSDFDGLDTIQEGLLAQVSCQV